MLSQAIQQVLFTRPLEKEVPDIVKKYGGSLYIPSPATCFQDSAGTTPCTVDSVVGLMLDTANPVLNRNLFKNTGFVGGVAGSPGTSPTSITISAATTGVTRTLAFGTTADGRPYMDVTYSGTNTSGSTSQPGIQSSTSSNPAIVNQVYTVSAELALVSGSWPTGAVMQILEFNSSSGYLTGNSTSIKTTVTGSTLTKVSHTRTLNNASTAYVAGFPIAFTINNNEAVNFTVRIANPQLELGSTATNFVPNTYMGYSVNQIVGNHAIQGTAGFKPILRGKVKNLLLNSATLSTQNITSVAAPYTLHFTGTGTVTLSGTSTAGPLVGTGANDRVSLTFTPTAGTLTLTVSGTVTTAQLELGTKANPYIPTTSAAASSSYGPYWLDFDGTDDRLQLGSVPFQMSGNQTVIISGQPLAASKPMFALAAGSTSESLPYLGTNASSYLGYEASGGGATITAFDTVSSLGINSVLSAVKTTDAIYVYKNSKAIATGTTSGTYTTATNAMLGGSGRSTVVSYRGSINLAAVLAQAATQTDMRKIEKYAAKLSGAQL